MEEKKSNSKINSLNKMKFYYDKLKEYDPTFLTNVQKEVILNSLEFIIEKQNVNNYQLNEFFKLLTQRVKTGFVFDEIPKSFNGFISIPKEIKKKEMKSFCGSDEKENINHFLFIGENYDVLKNLLITHKEKIDVIYIDPPYNTDSANSEGNFLSEKQEKNINNRFTYRDRFSRTGWLNMMKERLILAKDLLSKDGIIFISIDDNEHAYLKVLMDEIFNEENFICNFIWKKSAGGKHDTKTVAVDTEYILMYAKNKNEIKLNGRDSNINNFKDKDETGFFKLEQLDRGSLSYQKSLDFEITDENGKKYYPKNYFSHLERKNGKTTSKDWCWRWSQEKVKKEWNRIVFKGEKVFTKTYFDENKFIPYRNIIDNIGNRNANNEILSLFNERIFTYPKPVELTKFLIDLIPNKDALILDFFAGSGTTGHAVMKLNEKDNGQRKFILATNNENNIAQDITYERLYRIIKGETTNGNNDFGWINNNRPFANNNIKVFELNEIKVTPNQKLFDLSSEIINEYKKINPSFKLNNKSDIFFKLSSLEQRIDLGKENEINK